MEKKKHVVRVMTTEECEADDARQREKRLKKSRENMTFLDWIANYLKEEENVKARSN